jgi:hypothetical protein
VIWQARARRRGWLPFSRDAHTPICSFHLPKARQAHQWPGPRIRISMPSFSGGTAAVPQLLHYSCSLGANVRPVTAARVAALAGEEETDGYAGAACLSKVLSGRPLLALAFDNMDMAVLDHPVVLGGGLPQALAA